MARSSIGSEADESFWKPCNVVNWVLGKGGGGGEFVKADGVATFNDRWKSLVGENRYVEQSCRGFRGSLVHCRSYRIFLFFSSFCVWLFLLIFFLFA